MLACVLAGGCRIDFTPIQLDSAVSPDAVFGSHGDTGAQNAYAVDVGKDGSIAVVGAFENGLPFGSGLRTQGAQDAYVASLYPDGRLRWIRDLGGISDDVASGVAIDDAGNVTVTGHFTATVDFGTGPLDALGEEDIFLASYARDGTPRWAHRFGDTASGTPYGSDLGQALAVERATGELYLGGQFTGTVDFGTGPMTMTSTGDDVVLASFDRDGVIRWADHYGGGQLNKVAGITVDATGVVFTGYFQGTASFGGAALVTHGTNDIFVASYTRDGSFRWSTSFGGTGLDFGRGVALDVDGNAYVTGYYQGTVDFGAGPETAPGVLDGFVASLTSTGTYRWSHTFGAPCAKGEDVVSVSGRVYVVGQFDGALQRPALAGQGPGDGFVLAYDNAGGESSSLAYGGPGYDAAFASAALPGGDLVVVGEIGGPDTCASTTGPRAEEDMFVVRTSLP